MRNKILGSVLAVGAAVGLGFVGSGAASAALPAFDLTDGGSSATTSTVVIDRSADGRGPYTCIAVARPNGLPPGVNIAIPSNPTVVPADRATRLTISNLAPNTAYTVTATCTELPGLDVGSATVAVQTTAGGGGGGGTGSLSF
ncbi:hypothetical protein [Gordonia insulae]|uniref:Fibronectin type-III domain-containing protein n=1 Tax=Gordonia insulae TaxID=2420509 RepID=A0A3G8JR27_9ACTN|nr:hypothetical protein [Gordonia insulae]AZG47557.1 hypothetical protein D7316_04168 [Gordonia insulae]